MVMEIIWFLWNVCGAAEGILFMPDFAWSSDRRCWKSPGFVVVMGNVLR